MHTRKMHATSALCQPCKLRMTPSVAVRTATSHGWGTRDTQGLLLCDAVYISSSKRYLARADLNNITLRKNSLRKGAVVTGEGCA